ncbi:hypothetical protein QFC24_003006 [Naganishia onofrii]|uniref:Uncharacterized protein n=1 Tax=Naganishia onofrii TaxID=1851511 RepID=A0ACC2XMG5_9TREE|nr:hypothetical protein QFC24_003006 [Naganishia onofrii]
MEASDSVSSLIAGMAALSLTTTVPFDIVIEIGTLCAVYEVLKPALGQKIIVWDLTTLKKAWKSACKKGDTRAMMPQSWKQAE